MDYLKHHNIRNSQISCEVPYNLFEKYFFDKYVEKFYKIDSYSFKGDLARIYSFYKDLNKKIDSQEKLCLFSISSLCRELYEFLNCKTFKKSNVFAKYISKDGFSYDRFDTVARFVLSEFSIPEIWFKKNKTFSRTSLFLYPEFWYYQSISKFFFDSYDLLNYLNKMNFIGDGRLIIDSNYKIEVSVRDQIKSVFIMQDLKAS